MEEIRGCSIRSSSPQKSSCELSSPSSGTLASDGHVSSIDDFSPKSLEKHCRPINNVVLETEHKGTLVERLAGVEDRVLKVIKILCFFSIPYICVYIYKNVTCNVNNYACGL